MTWLFSKALLESLVNMSSSQEQEGESLKDVSLDGKQFAQLNVMRTQQQFWRNDKMMESSSLSRFGLTLQLLTESHGAVVLMSYLEAFPVKTYQLQEGGAGIEGSRSGLWSEMARIIGEVRPYFVEVENSPMLVGRGLALVISDLAEMGYECEWVCISAADCGAPHQRDRLWLVAHLTDTNCQSNGQQYTHAEKGSHSQREILELAHTQSERCVSERLSIRTEKELPIPGFSSKDVANTSSQHEQRFFTSYPYKKIWQGPKQRPAGSCSNGNQWWSVEPDVDRVANGLAFRVDRLKAIGNGQVPAVAARAWQILLDRQ